MKIKQIGMIKSMKLFAIVLCLLFNSCLKNEKYEYSGFVINKSTGKVMPGIKVSFQVAIGENSSSISSSTGYYHIEGRSGSNRDKIIVEQEVNQYDNNTTTYFDVDQSNNELNLEIDPIAYFNGIFYKTSSLADESDKLMVRLLSYEDINLNLNGAYTQIFYGIGKFEYNDNNYSDQRVIGDRFLRYELEFYNNGNTQTKIDSIFIPASIELFNDTIFY